MQVRLPILNVFLAPVDKIKANNYNPNRVQEQELKLLETSILANGFCFPLVCVKDGEDYVIVDGFHRFTVGQNLGMEAFPIVVLEHAMSKRMAATVQFNRARGKHDISLQADMLRELIEFGYSDARIAKELGMTREEVFRLKQQTGVVALFKDADYSNAWEVRGK